MSHRLVLWAIKAMKNGQSSVLVKHKISVFGMCVLFTMENCVGYISLIL